MTGRDNDLVVRAPVAVAPIVQDGIVLRRTFTGALEAHASFTVAPKVAGRVETIAVDIADPVRRGQVVAQLDDAEYEQDVARAQADLAVAEANLEEAGSLAAIARREVERFRGLSDFTTTSQLEAAEAELLAREARFTVSEAQITRAVSALKSARIRLGYTSVIAQWDGPDEERVVAERFVDEGDTVSANSPLLRIVDLDRLIAVIFVTERDYASLHPGQEATFATDAFPGEAFSASILRIAPVFRETTRQARVELLAPNPQHRLKPGMFVRAMLTLDRANDATIVPEAALTRRNETDGVFLVDEASLTARWVPVRTGIRDSGRVQVIGDGLSGRVVVLGQHLIDDGSPLTIPGESRAAPGT